MGKKWKHWNLTIFLKYKNLDYFLELFNLEFFVVIFFSFLKLTHVFIGLSVSDYKRQGFSLTFLQLDNLLSTYYVWGIMLCLLWVILWYLRNNHIPRVLFISSLVWQVKNLKHNGVQDFRAINDNTKFWNQTVWLQNWCFYLWRSTANVLFFYSSMYHIFPFVAKGFALEEPQHSLLGNMNYKCLSSF